MASNLVEKTDAEKYYLVRFTALSPIFRRQSAREPQLQPSREPAPTNPWPARPQTTGFSARQRKKCPVPRGAKSTGEIYRRQWALRPVENDPRICVVGRRRGRTFTDPHRRNECGGVECRLSQTFTKSRKRLENFPHMVMTCGSPSEAAAEKSARPERL